MTRSKIEALIVRLLPFFTMGLMVFLFIIGLFIFSYVLIFAAIIGFVLFIISAIRARFTVSKNTNAQTKQFENNKGRIIEHEEEVEKINKN